MEIEKFNCMLEIDILKKKFTKKLGVLFKGLGVQKRHPDALLAKTTWHKA